MTAPNHCMRSSSAWSFRLIAVQPSWPRASSRLRASATFGPVRGDRRPGRRRPATEDVLASLATPFPLRVIVQEQSGAGSARNHGAAHARAPFLLFLDDDVVAAPSLVAAHLVAQPAGGGVVGIGRIDKMLSPRPARWARSRQLAWRDHYDRLAAGREARFTDCYGGNLCVPRISFAAVGGFAEDIAVEHDVELGYRLARAGVGSRTCQTRSPARKTVTRCVTTSGCPATRGCRSRPLRAAPCTPPRSPPGRSRRAGEALGGAAAPADGDSTCLRCCSVSLVLRSRANIVPDSGTGSCSATATGEACAVQSTAPRGSGCAGGARSSCTTPSEAGTSRRAATSSPSAGSSGRWPGSGSGDTT